MATTLAATALARGVAAAASESGLDADTLEISIATAGSSMDRKSRIAAAAETMGDPGKNWVSCT
jgi:hypothetical protein